MKVVAINGSPHKKGNTFHALTEIGKQLESEGIEFEIIHIGNQVIRGCIACGGCRKNMDEKCMINDTVNDYIQQMKAADGIILGAPVHYAGIPGTMKSFLDRAFYVSTSNNNLFRHKVGMAVVTLRRSGGTSTFDGLNHYLNYSEMMLASSNYWNIIHGRTPGKVLEDTEGMQIMQVLGKNMAWMLKLRDQTKDSIEAPKAVEKILTNFIR